VSRTPDVLVVGAGVVGLSVARALRDRGLHPLVVDRAGVGEGQSGIQPGGIRLQWGTPVACALARESHAWWRTASEELDSRAFAFSTCGYVFLAHSERALQRLTASVSVQNAAGIPSRILSAEEAAALVPGLLVETVAGASYCAEDGYLDRPQAAVAALARGIDVHIATVEAVIPNRTGWDIETSAGRLSASAVVLAAGVETRALVAPLGIELPIEPEPRHLFLSQPIRERLLEPLVVSAERQFAAKQLYSGRVLTSYLGASGDPQREAPRWRQHVRAVIRELLPILEYVDLTTVATGAYDVTPDRQPILGPLPEYEGLHVAAGFSGHGLMIAPAVARLVGDAVVGKRDPLLEVLDPLRFSEGRLLPEPQVI
jgi:sarcosine oxidase subunit beta